MDKSKEYTGYIWMSDKQEPDVYLNRRIENEHLFDEGQNPFVIEAQLVSDNESVSVKFCDGKYIEVITPLSQTVNGDKLEFVSQRIQGRILRFAQLWREDEDDDLCCGMKPLIPGRFVFLGFSNG